MRVLFAPRNISGQATEMATAISRRGHTGEVWSFGPTAFGFEADRIFDRDRLLTHPDYRWDMFDTAVRSFDVFHFIYGRSLLDPVDPALPPLWDIPILKALGKRVVMHYRGSDVRLPSLHRQREPDSYFKNSEMEVDEEHLRRRLSIARRHCDALLVSTPGLLDYVPDGILVPHTLDVGAWYRERPAEPQVPVVVHIPSNPHIKGTPAVDAALEPLEKSGLIRYRKLEGVDRAELQRVLSDADLIVDSLQIGDHGLISTEAMASGCIAIAHIHPGNRDRTPGVPVIEATGETLASVVADLAIDPERRAALRRDGLQWVKNHHSHEVVGEALDALYRRPIAEPQLHRPDWPIEASAQRIAKLEHEIERLTSDGHELFAGWVPPARTTPTWQINRLVNHIRELERRVVAYGGTVDNPLMDSRLGRPRSSSLQRLVKSRPWLHRLARKFRRRIGRA